MLILELIGLGPELDPLSPLNLSVMVKQIWIKLAQKLYIPAMAWPHTLPDPVTTLMTPGGIPALCDNSANLRAVSGQTCAGLMTTVLPAARHAAIFQDSIISG